MADLGGVWGHGSLAVHHSLYLVDRVRFASHDGAGNCQSVSTRSGALDARPARHSLDQCFMDHSLRIARRGLRAAGDLALALEKADPRSEKVAGLLSIIPVLYSEHVRAIREEIAAPRL